MKAKMFALLLLAGGSLFARPHVFVGVGFGGGYYAPPPAPLVAYASPCPGPGYTWVGGYWYPVGGRYSWHAGYWTRPPHVGARWIAPRYYGHRYFYGYWRR